MENEEHWDFDIFELEAATHKRSVNSRAQKLELLKTDLKSWLQDDISFLYLCF